MNKAIRCATVCMMMIAAFSASCWAAGGTVLPGAQVDQVNPAKTSAADLAANTGQKAMDARNAAVALASSQPIVAAQLSIFTPITTGNIKANYQWTNPDGSIESAVAQSSVQLNTVIVYTKTGVPINTNVFSGTITVTSTKLVSGALKQTTYSLDVATGNLTITNLTKTNQYEEKSVILVSKSMLGYSTWVNKMKSVVTNLISHDPIVANTAKAINANIDAFTMLYVLTL